MFHASCFTLHEILFPDSIKKFINIFSELPSIGPRQATRLAFYLISGGKGRLEEFSKSIADLKNVKICSDCFFVHSNIGANPLRNENYPRESASSLCNICLDKNRNKKIIMIVEKETDLISIERTKKFKGRYLILGDLKKGGILESDQKLRLANLKAFIAKEIGGSADEIIIATNPTTYGDLNAMIIQKELEGYAKKFSRLGRGIPTGGEIEFADEETLEQALERRS